MKQKTVSTTDSEASTGPTRKITINEIAAETNVSKATVSLVLRNSPSIPEKTRARVLEAAQRLGYVYNRGAASLRGRQTNTVGVIVNDLTNPYFAEIVSSIQQRLTEIGQFSLLCNTGESLDIQSSFVEKLREYNVDGIVLSPAEGTSPEWLREVSATGIPLVLFSRYIDAGIDAVGADNIGGMRLAMEHLIELGHRRIALVGANQRNSTGSDRLDGYLKALAVARLPVDEALLKYCPPTRDHGFQAIHELMQLDDPPTAVACFNDVLAFGVMLGLRALDISIGEQVSVVGFDDIAEAALWRPRLTTVAVPRHDLAVETSNILVRRIGSNSAGPIVRTLLQPQLLIRETTSPNRRVPARADQVRT